MSETADPKPLTPDAKERLAAALRDKLARQRLRRLPWIIGGAFVLLAAIVGLWFAFQTPPELPPLMLIAYDALEADGEVKAQLVAPGNPDVKLQDVDVLWQMRDIVHDEKMTTRTDPAGIARYKLGAGDTPGRMIPAVLLFDPIMHVSFLEPTGKYRRDKSIKLWSDETFGPSPILVSVADLTAAGKPIDWTQRDLKAYPAPPSRRDVGLAGVAEGRMGVKPAIIYASGDVDWATYQRMHDWLEKHAGDKDTDPAAGPLLHEDADAIERRLKARPLGEKLRRWQTPR